VQTARDIYNELRHVQKQLESGLSARTPSEPAVAVAAGTWIAVLPFSSTASDADVQALADGLTDDITAGLSRFDYLSVVAAHTARRHASVESDARQLGVALGAQ
jgi:TolB-like protein